jgi:probable addiction module antidote protein
MSVKIAPYDSADYLKTEDDIAHYLSTVIEIGDAADLQNAIGVAVRAHGMMKVCEATGFTRQGIAKATRSPTKPSFETMTALLRALGLTFQIVPINHARDSQAAAA